ncbi:MAG: YtxH domain-containing protein [Candidatus Uhrbacteria bacterium]|nr:YtxH domain-containing protein [Candidatus Uhrbacteria bacterium]
MSKAPSSHLRAGLVAGAILGLAAGLFLQSRQGKKLTKDAQKKAVQLQAQVMKKLKGIENMSKAKYTEIVDHVLAYYTKTREIAKTEVPQVRSYLLARWKEIEREFKQVGK